MPPKTKVCLILFYEGSPKRCSKFLSSQQQTKKTAKPKKVQLKYSVDCSTPVEDEIMDAGAFVS